VRGSRGYEPKAPEWGPEGRPNGGSRKGLEEALSGGEKPVAESHNTRVGRRGCEKREPSRDGGRDGILRTRELKKKVRRRIEHA